MIFFFLLYAYNTTTARSDGYDVTMFEFSVRFYSSHSLASTHPSEKKRR